MAVYLVNSGFEAAPAAALEKRLRAALPDITSLTGIDELGGKLAPSADDPTFVLLLASLRDRARVQRTLDLVAQHGARAFFVVIGEEMSASDYKALVRNRTADWVAADADPREVLDIIARARRPAETRPAGGSGGRAVAIAFAASAGGVGNATLAVETAVKLKTDKATRQRNVCIVDLDFQGSHVCDHLDIEPRLQIAEISADPGRLDAQLFEIFASRHASGAHVFAAPRSRFDACGLHIAALDRLFDMMAARYDLILVDLPPVWLAWTPQIIAACNGVVVTGLNTIPGLRRAAETLAAVRQSATPSAQIAIAVNRCQRALIGGVARRQHVESVLAGEQVLYVGDEPALIDSINAGTPAIAANPSRHWAKAIGLIARFCADVAPAAAARTLA
ncbi:MAG TPA: AAA family ATPase [Xanthobacteraceae bacterium]